MSKRNKALRNILVGVAIGAGVTLLNKENREKITRKGKNVTKKLNEMKQDPELVKDAVKSQLKVVQNSVEKLEDNVQLVKDKWIEIKGSTKNKFGGSKNVTAVNKVDEVKNSIVLEPKTDGSVESVVIKPKTEEIADDIPSQTTEKVDNVDVEAQLAASLEGIEDLTEENVDEVEKKVSSILFEGTAKE